MTKEAINELKKYTSGRKNTEKIEVSVLALNRIIFALEQEPCEDAINRQAVLNTLDNMDKVLDEDRTVENYKELLKECYKVLTPVSPQPKTRLCKWIKYDNRTICPKEHDTDNPFWRIPENRKEALKYCPYCGLEIEIEETGE